MIRDALGFSRWRYVDIGTQLHGKHHPVDQFRASSLIISALSSRSMGRSEKTKTTKPGTNKQSPNKNVKKKQALQSVQDGVVDVDCSQLSQSTDIGVQNTQTVQEIAEDEDEDGNNALIASNIQLW